MLIPKSSRILHWIQVTADEARKEGIDFSFTTSQARKRFKRYPRGTITSALTRFYQQGLIDRIKRGTYTVLSVWYEHFVSTVFYCGMHHSQKETWYAIVHAPFGGSLDPYNDLSESLMKAITARRKDCYHMEDLLQYQNTKQIKTPNKRYTFPYAETGKLDKKFKKTLVKVVKI